MFEKRRAGDRPTMSDPRLRPPTVLKFAAACWSLDWLGDAFQVAKHLKLRQGAALPCPFFEHESTHTTAASVIIQYSSINSINLDDD